MTSHEISIISSGQNTKNDLLSMHLNCHVELQHNTVVRSQQKNEKDGRNYRHWSRLDAFKFQVTEKSSASGR